MGKWRARMDNFLMKWAWRLKNKVIDPNMEAHIMAMKEMRIRGLSSLTGSDRQNAYDNLIQELSEGGLIALRPARHLFD